jgi:hypothetical protein
VYKSLKVIIPTVQMLTVVGVLVWQKMALTDRMQTLYVLPTSHLILNLNIPLVAIWWPFIFGIDPVGKYLPFLQKPHPQMVIGFAFVMILFLSIGLFWYFVVVEVQLRMRGQSLMRFSNRIVESVKVVGLFFGGIGTFFYGYTETIRPSQHGLARFGLWPAEIVLTVFFLAIWGTAFIGISIYDLRKWPTTMRESGSQLGDTKS